MSGMPGISFILSQFFGLYMLIIAFLMFYRVNEYRQMVQMMNPHSGTLLLAGLIGLMLGMILVGLQNVWVFQPKVFVTMICWLVLILSIMILFMPVRVVLMIRKIFSGSGYYALLVLLMITGSLLLARGVYVYVMHRDVFAFQ